MSTIVPHATSAPVRLVRNWPLGIRTAHADDRDAVFAFARATWGGWDYIAGVWDAWVADTVGTLLVATAQPAPDGTPPAGRDGAPLAPGRVIAITHLAMLSPTEGWIEGIRVDPGVRGMDVATDLQVAVLAAARERGATVVRWITGQENEGSLRLAARLGMERVGAWRVRGRPWGHDGDGDRAGSSGPVAVTEALAAAERDGILLPASADAVSWFGRVDADPTFRAGHRLYEHASWDHEVLTQAKLADRIRAGEVLAVGPEPDGRWAMLVLNRTRSLADGLLHCSLLVGDGGLAVMLLDRLGGASGPLARLRLPDPAPVLDGHEPDWERLGYHANEGRMVIVERALD